MKSNSELLNLIFQNLYNNYEDVIFDTKTGKNISGNQLFLKVCNIQQFFIKNNFKKGDKILVFTNKQIDFIAIILASLSLGGIVVILEPGMGKEILKNKIENISPNFIFLEGILYDIFFLDKLGILQKILIKNIPENIYYNSSKIITVGKSLFSREKLEKIYIKNNSNFLEKIDLDENSEALIVFTGGTTSEPKGVIHNHKSLHQTIIQTQKIVGKYKTFYADLFHFALLGLAYGSKVILGQDSYNAEKLNKILTQNKVECIFLAPYKIQEFISKNIFFPKDLKCLLIGSAPIYSSFLKRLFQVSHENLKTICIYGMTEMLPISFIDGKEKLKISEKFDGDILGKIIPNISYEIIDSELFVFGQNASPKYLGKENHKFIETGDLVYEKDGYLVMKGRKKDMIIRGNYNIYPNIYEPIILKIPGILECAMFGIKENDFDEFVALIIDSEIQYSKEEIFKLLKNGNYSIDNFAIPQYIFFGKIPKIGRQNKIDKNKLSKIYSNEINGKL